MHTRINTHAHSQTHTQTHKTIDLQNVEREKEFL